MKQEKETNAKILAAVSYLSVVGLIILLIEKKSKFVIHHAKQGTALFALEVILMILAYIPFVNMVVPLLGVLLFGVTIYGIVLALKNSEEKIPLINDLGEKIADLLKKK